MWILGLKGLSGCPLCRVCRVSQLVLYMVVPVSSDTDCVMQIV